MPILSLRSVVERISRGKVFWRRLPSEFDSLPLRVSPDAALQLLKPGSQAFDPMLLRFCDEYVQRGSVVWDVGANLGIFALAAAQRGGKVLAVEPDFFLYSLLCKTQKHKVNQRFDFEPLNTAIAAKPGTARLAIAQRGRASNYLTKFEGRSQTGGVRFTTLVPVLTLDLLLQGHQKPTIIKIDVEGAEAEVIEGALQILSDTQPIILIEVGNTTRKDVIDRLINLKYQVIDYETGVECRVDSDFGNNLLALPI